MGAKRTLRRKIVPAAVQIAKINAAKRWRKYLHASARRRLERQQQALGGHAMVTAPNRAS